MNDRTAGAILLVIGVVAIFAAIVGGGIKIEHIEVGSVQSKWRQWLLAAFGLVVGLVGLIMVLPDDKTADEANNVEVLDENAPVIDDNAAVVDENAPVTDDNAAVVDENASEAITDENATDVSQQNEAQ
jgi:hypothetical protein